MAAGDLSDAMVARTRERLGEWSTDGLLDAEIFARLNHGQFDLAWRLPDATMLGLQSSATASLSSSAFTLPTDFWRFRRLKVGSYYAKLWAVSKVEALRGQAKPAAATPFCTIWGQTCTVHIAAPTSTATYLLDYMAEPATITTSIDPDFDTNLHYMIETFAVVECLRLRQRWDEAAIIRAEYEDLVKIIVSRYSEGPLYEGRAVDPIA